MYACINSLCVQTIILYTDAFLFRLFLSVKIIWLHLKQQKIVNLNKKTSIVSFKDVKRRVSWKKILISMQFDKYLTKILNIWHIFIIFRIISTSDQNANEELSQLSFSYIAGIMLFFVFVETHGKGKLNRYTQLLFVVLLLLYPANFFAAFMIVYSTVNMINGCSKINQKSKNIKRRNFLKTSRNWNFRNFKKFLRVIKSILNVAIKICLIVLNVLWNLLLQSF